ncbi:MAG TPA: NAD-dependent epimerase/dehydratase family protein [Mycobacteriales bacterium]|nr:NAD-dependent epimerase/dehydratase family protein [Mycobacteriales bacterium]
MDVFLTGGTGFIGGEVARRLRARGDGVRALVRDRSRAQALEDLGCELVVGDLSDESALQAACSGADAVVHGAAVYEVGVPEDRRPVLVDANVGGTERVLGAALAAGVRKAVYVSTVAVFGNTRGAVADETWTRRDDVPVTSVYEQTKAHAHRRAHEIAARGLPLVIVQPGVVYGPGDPSTFGELLKQFLTGRLPALPFPDFGMTPVHRDDVAAGVLLALDSGVPGESYVLAGEPTTNRELLTVLAGVAGRRPPSRTVPTVLLKALAPAGRVVGPLLGFPPNLRELISSSDGVTFWASSAKAQRELGWSYRPLEDGLREVVADVRPAAAR